MKYVVGLVEYSKATHKWVYDNYADALHQLRLLLEVYDEVNEIQPVLLKVYYATADYPLGYILKTYSHPPKCSSDAYKE